MEESRPAGKRAVGSRHTRSRRIRFGREDFHGWIKVWELDRRGWWRRRCQRGRRLLEDERGGATGREERAEVGVEIRAAAELLKVPKMTSWSENGVATIARRRTSSEKAWNWCWHESVCSTSSDPFTPSTTSGTETCSRGSNVMSLGGTAPGLSSSGASPTRSSSRSGTFRCWNGCDARMPGVYTAGGRPVVRYATRYSSMRSSCPRLHVVGGGAGGARPAKTRLEALLKRPARGGDVHVRDSAFGDAVQLQRRSGAPCCHFGPRCNDLGQKPEKSGRLAQR